MPGHTSKKQAQRTKGNVRPSSSSQAAQLLAEAGTAPTGFIGFGGFSGNPGYVPASQAFDDIDSSLDSDFRMVLRKLTKKDSTTKIKALQEFSTLCEEKDVELLKAVLPFWPRIYNKVAIDVDHKVRETTQQAMNTLVLRVRKNLAPYLKSLMGTWLLCQCDTYQTVATASQQAFQTAFPPAKQTDALVFCKSVICEYLTDNLLNQTPNTLSDPQTTEKDDMVNKYNRVLASSLLAFRKLLTSLQTNQIEDLKEPIRALLGDGKFWKHGKSTVLSVKSGMYTFLAGVCQISPDVAQEFSKKISPYILNNIDEKDPVICPSVWEAVLSLVNYVQDCWRDVSVEKSVWPKLRKLLENGCYGNSTLIGPDLLPFISKVPADLLKDKYMIYTEFLSHMKQGLTKDELQSNKQEMSAFVKAYMECTHFVLKEVTDTAVLNIVLTDRLLPVVLSSVVESPSVLSTSPLYGMLGITFGKIENTGNDDVTSTVLSYWSDLADRIIDRLGSEEETVTMTIVDRVVLLVKNLVFPPISKVEEKLGKIKISAGDENKETKRKDTYKLTTGMSSFVQKLSLYSFQSAHEHFNTPCLTLFASLMELHPAEKTIKSVIDSCHGDVETDQSHSNYFVFNVCLPWLQSIEADDQKQVISIICTFMAMLDNSSLTVLLQTLTETVQSFECFHHLLSKCISLRASFNCIRTWLLSDIFGEKIVSIATIVCSESVKPGKEINTQCGWEIISLVLTAEQDSDLVIREEYIRQILQIIHNTLLSLRDNTDSDKADVAIRFVSKATHSFFLSSQGCLLMPSAEDLLITLFTISLDNTYNISDETMSEAESVWSSGYTSIVKQTGGLLQDGRLLQKTVSVIKDRVKIIESSDIFEKVMETVNRLLSVVRKSLPGDKGDNSVMAELVHSLYILSDHHSPAQVIHYYMLKGEVTYLNIPPRSRTDVSFTEMLFSTLFNVRLLYSVRVIPGEPGTSTIELDPEETKLLLSVTYCLNILLQWKQVVRNILTSLTLSTSTKSLESSVTTLIQKLSCDSRKYLVSGALDMACDKGSFWTAALKSVLQVVSMDTSFLLDFNSILDRCSDLDQSRVQVLEVASQYISADNRNTLAEIMVARMISSEPVLSVNGGIQALSVLNVVSMDTVTSDNVKELLRTALSQILTWKEENEDLFLYASNVDEDKAEVVFANVEIMKFLGHIVCHVPTMLTDKDWDFIMCSVVSFVQSIEESAERLSDSVTVQMFTCGACRLLSAVVDCLHCQVTMVTESFPSNLLTEWNEFFSEGIYGVLMPLFVKMTAKQQSAITGQMSVVLKSVSMATSQCPKQQVLDHKLPPYLKTDNTGDLPDSLQTLLNHVCPLLSHDSREVQLAAFHLLYSIMPELPQYDKENKETDQEELSRCPPQQIMSVLQTCYGLEDSLSGLGLEDCMKIPPATNDYTVALSYLLTWRLLMVFFRSSTAEIRQEYAIYFRQTGLVDQLLANVFRLMPDTISPSVYDKNFQLQIKEEESSRDIQCLACNVYRHTLQTVPAMVRQWWKQQDRKTINYIDRFTSKNVSQILCTEEIQPVSKTDSQLDNITIKTRPLTREVIATYALEEVTIEMVIALPENYPLGNITVVSEKRVGVTAAVWDKWLLQLNVFLQYQNGSIVDGLKIWKKNIDKRFEGVDDCMICFSVIHGTNYQLPRLTCKTCKKKFHSACLYKWFQTSHNSTCPLCRNLF